MRFMKILGIPLLALVLAISFSPYSAFAANQIAADWNTEYGDTGAVTGQHQYGRATLTLVSGPSNARKTVNVYEYCDWAPTVIGTLTVTASNPTATNNYYMSGSCMYYMTYTPYPSNTTNTYANLIIQNYPN